MKPGELRRFRGDLVSFGATGLAGLTFVILKVTKEGAHQGVDILLEGKAVGPMSYRWLKQNSEVLNEAR